MIRPLKTIWNKVRGLKSKTQPGKAKTIQTPSKKDSAEPGTAGDQHRPKVVRATPKKDQRRPKSRSKGTGPSRQQEQPQWDPASFDVLPAEGKTRFQDLNLPESILHAIADLGFQYCTPIQAEILPSILQGKDATGKAQTGTGKTAAFIISVLAHMLAKPVSSKRPPGTPRILVVAPTRELVMQIADEAKELAKYTSFRVVSVFGGMDYEKQRSSLTNTRTDIVVATPGRLLDFKRRRDVDLSQVEVVIIDEADRMLDMGFIPDVRKIIYSTPHKSKRQTLFFSATITPDVNRLAEQWTRQPIKVEIEPEQVAVDTVEQLVYIVTNEDKNTLLYNIITMKELNQVIVFCNRKDETRRLTEMLKRYDMDCAILSGDVRQHTRVRTLNKFKAGKIRVLVATDVAGRGIHIEGMDHVINYTLPRDPEDYVHRIGRTGRAGSTGTSISFADEEDSFYIPAIEELIGNGLPCIYPEEEWLKPLPPPPKSKTAPEQDGQRRSSSRRSSGQRRNRRTSQGSRKPQAQGSGKPQGSRKPRRRRPPRKDTDAS